MNRRVNPYPPPSLAFTRYCFTSKLYCGSQSSFYCPLHMQSLPYCITVAQPLRNIHPPTDPPLYGMHHTLLVMAISCEGQPLALFAPPGASTTCAASSPWFCSSSSLISFLGTLPLGSTRDAHYRWIGI